MNKSTQPLFYPLPKPQTWDSLEKRELNFVPRDHKIVFPDDYGCGFSLCSTLGTDKTLLVDPTIDQETPLCSCGPALQRINNQSQTMSTVCLALIRSQPSIQST